MKIKLSMYGIRRFETGTLSCQTMKIPLATQVASAKTPFNFEPISFFIKILKLLRALFEIENLSASRSFCGEY